MTVKFDNLYRQLLYESNEDIIHCILSLYKKDRKDFELCRLSDNIGYLVEVWNDECFTELRGLSGIPKNPQEYIKNKGNAEVLSDIKKYLPNNWRHSFTHYIPQYKNTNYGIAIFVFDIE